MNWQFELIFRSFPIILLSMGYFVFWWFRRWIKVWGISEKRTKKIFLLYHILLILLAIPWLTFTFMGPQKIPIVSKWINIFYLYPAHAWQLTHICLFIILFSYSAIKLVVRAINQLYRKLSHSTSGVDHSKRKWLKKSAILIPSSILYVNIIGVYKSEYDFIVEKKTIYIKNLPENLKGIKITQISDIHFGPFLDDKKFSIYAKEINRIKSDLIVVTGDIVNSSEELIPMARNSLSELRAVAGIYGCMGNHEYYVMKAHKHQNRALYFKKRFEGVVEILLDESRLIKLRGDEFYLLGIDYPMGQTMRLKSDRINYHLQKTLQGTDKQIPKILLAHHPDTFFESQKYDIDLTLSGHTHGGQVVFGEIGECKISPMQLSYKYLKGHYFHMPNRIEIASFENDILKNIKNEKNKNDILTFYLKDNNNYVLKEHLTEKERTKISDILKSVQYYGKQLYVNSGLGHWLPIRYNCPAEITQFILE